MSAVTKLMTPGGGGVALTPASSIASDVTVNVPSQNCTLDIQGPAFSAYITGNQTVSNVTATKLQFNTVLFDTAGVFNTTTYRATPNVAGYYQITGVAVTTDTTPGHNITLQIYKNGSLYIVGSSSSGSSNTFGTTVGTTLMYLNGTTDYCEMYIYTDTGGSATIYGSSQSNSQFSGSLVRAA